MSSAHRPTWAPAQGKDSRGNSKIYSSRDIATHTRLKFRQPGQGAADEVSRRDLKLELLAAERDSAARKAKGQAGYVPDQTLLMLENQAAQEEADAQIKRRKVLADVSALDADDDDDAADDDDQEDRDASEDDAPSGADKGKGKGKAVDVAAQGSDDDDDDDEDDSDDDEDETAELLRELEKIKKERAEEKEKVERERLASEQTNREEEIAMGNPLLNLQSALNYSASPTPSTLSSSTASFGVKRRWDDDVIFKNQTRGTTETPRKEFVNDLLRTDYHRRFLKRFVA